MDSLMILAITAWIELTLYCIHLSKKDDKFWKSLKGQGGTPDPHHQSKQETHHNDDQ